MSHFTVMVKIPNHMVEKFGLEDAVTRQLAPYRENNTGDCPKEYLEFFDVEEKYKEEYETKEAEFVLTPDGRLTWPWDYDETIPGTFNKKRNIPDDHQLVIRPLKEKYSSFEEFIEDYAGYKRDPETGRYGYWENPNARWDWYQIGGRWQGFFRLKETAIMSGTAQRGRPSLMALMSKKGAEETRKRLKDPHTADAAQFKDIDFEGMHAEADTQIREFYKDVEEIRRLEAEGKDISGDLICTRWTACNFGLVNREEDGKYTTMKTTFTLEDLLTEYRHYWEWSTYAVVNEEGRWHEKATMGWFGCDNGDEDDYRTWQRFFKQDHLTNVDPDTWIVIVDCHI